MNSSNLFGLSDHIEALSKHGDPLEVLDATVDFEYFRGWLVDGLGYGDGAKGGRPPFDPVSMFKALILQAQHNLSDAQMEFIIRDRLSWMRFLGFDLGATTPDENTIRHFRNRLTVPQNIGVLAARPLIKPEWLAVDAGCAKKMVIVLHQNLTSLARPTQSRLRRRSTHDALAAVQRQLHPTNHDPSLTHYVIEGDIKGCFAAQFSVNIRPIKFGGLPAPTRQIDVERASAQDHHLTDHPATASSVQPHPSAGKTPKPLLAPTTGSAPPGVLKIRLLEAAGLPVSCASTISASPPPPPFKRTARWPVKGCLKTDAKAPDQGWPDAIGIGGPITPECA